MSISREFDSYSQPIRFVRLNSEHAQTSRFLLLALGARPVGTRMSFTHMLTVAHALWITRCRDLVFVLSLVFVLPLEFNLCHITFPRTIQVMENGLEKILNQATDSRFTGA